MTKLMLVALFAVLARPAGCQEEDSGGFDFKQDVRQLAVADGQVYVATDDWLHQLSHDLRLSQRVSLLGVWNGTGMLRRVSEANERSATFGVHVLLPFVRNRTLIICGSISGCGYCEIRNLGKISEVIHWEQIQVGPHWRSSESVAVVVNLTKTQGPTEMYILTAVEHPRQYLSISCGDTNTLRLLNTKEDQRGGIFSISSDSSSADLEYKGSGKVKFVDGFQIGAVIYLILYEENITTQAHLLWFEGNEGKSIKDIHGAILAPGDASKKATKVVASCLVPGVPGVPKVLWVGVFAVDGEKTNTQLVLFDISSNLKNRTEMEFPLGRPPNPAEKLLKTLTPEAVIFRQNRMTSVLAVRQRAWMVFFIGTDGGQVIKLTVDNNYNSACPSVLYEANNDDKVFPKIHIDQVDRKHIYVRFPKQIKRMPMAKCSSYTTVEDCWSAQDPYCVWCISKSSCTYEDDCRGTDWLSIADNFQQKMISIRVVQKNADQIELIAQTHVSVSQSSLSNITCGCRADSGELNCVQETSQPIPYCKCTLEIRELPVEGLLVSVNTRLWTIDLSQQMRIFNCSSMAGEHTSSRCRQCLEAGCGWSETGCTWANQNAGNVSICQKLPSKRKSNTPVIYSVDPKMVSFYGKNQATLTGKNLGDVIGVRIQADLDCKLLESPITSNSGNSLTFQIPRANTKGPARVCVLLADGTCHGSTNITYCSAPSCLSITPNSSWFSGNRKITLIGSHLSFVDAVSQIPLPQKYLTVTETAGQNLTFQSLEMKNWYVFQSQVNLVVANHIVNCSQFINYYPEPEFSNFTATRFADSIIVHIQKKADNLDISLEELSIWGVQRGNEYKCVITKKETNNETDFFTCKIEGTSDATFQKLKIIYGNKEVFLTPKSVPLYSLLSLIFFVPILIIIILVVIFYRHKQKILTDQMDKRMEELELGIRNDIRQGFVDLQTENAELLENVGAIPFLDYKHFAAKIFFPETESLMASCIKDIDQDVVQVQLDQPSQAMSRLIHNQLFLTSMVHALEEQKSFGIKDKCVFASLLTVALHSDLPYLTEVMASLLCDLMHQRSATQPKLLLRRTESIVEKLLSNWMSICLYGFLRETVGQHLFLIVSALTQQMAKGPVDCVTGKALYTLSEDWLLWQAQDFTTLKLKVLFAVGCDGEVSEPLDVNALNCDTVEQLKGKILTSFKNKFGFPYCTPIRELCVEYQKNGSFVPLEEVDASSLVIGEVTMFNTLKHYEVLDGATVKVLSRKAHPPVSPQGSLMDDENVSAKYFHLIDPEDVEDQRTNPEKKKFKLKEVHLTKLLSTKVAVHSFVENLFKSIWGTTNCKVPMAVKYFFDFLDAQADNMKINDPDVLHIWKTNSLPLRYWVNIIKNPQFVFDIEKTAHLDGCLSVIAQAFMDSFSLSDAQLGKYAPTNKLLYAKDIPKFKQDVKSYYKQIRDQLPITSSEFKSFLLEESKKHENEFNKAVALRELHKFIQCYLPKIKEKLDQNGAPAELTEQLHHVKTLFDQQRSCSWN